MEKALRHLELADPVLARLIRRIGPFAMNYGEPSFGYLARCIVGQQLSGKAASTIFGRLRDSLDGHCEPDRVLAAEPAQLRAAGLSGSKAASLRDLAERTAGGSIPFEALAELPDEDVIHILTQVKGVGVWTAQMFLMFALQRPDVLPCADLGVRAAMRNLYGLKELPKPADMEEIAAPWQPYRSIACWYLWRSLDQPADVAG